MKKSQILVFFLVFPATFNLIAAITSAGNTLQFQKQPLTIHTPSKNYTYHVEMAISDAEQEQGLMYRTQLGENEGMLFPLEHDREMQMWMKNTQIPLDMLFIDKHGKIIYIARNTTPNSLNVISSGGPVHAVLELAGGTTHKRHIDQGDIVIHSVFKP